MENQVASKNKEFSTFIIGDAVCGIDILKINEINRNFEITEVPMAKDHIKGIINLRGKIVTIVDLGKRLGLSPVKIEEDTRNIIVSSQNEDIGLVVDKVCDVVSANPRNIEPSPSNLGKISGIHFTGVLKTEERLIGLLNIDSLLSQEKI